MMEELAEYDNLIRAMGAMFYTSKRMADKVPTVFQAWKEYSFEMRARKIHSILSDSVVKGNQNESAKKASASLRLEHLGSQGQTIDHYHFTTN